MKSANPKLSALRFVDPTRWRAEIIAALKLTNDNVEAAAKRLRIHYVTLHRWLAGDAELRIARRKLVKGEKEASK